MSRIHEALQRAEQERKLRDISSVEPSSHDTASTLSTLTGTSIDNSGTVLPDPPPFVPPLLSGNIAPLAIDTLTTHCRSVAWAPQPRSALFSREKNRPYKAEVFRTLRSRLYRLRDHIRLRSLLVTSTLPCEGKSFIAANLSQAIAQQHGSRAILIDADLRMPSQHIQLGAPRSPGLSEYLQGDTDELSIVQRGQGHDLYFISCGAAATNPVELIGNGRMKTLLDCLHNAFDWIIVDSPPMAAVSDAGLLADMCDGALLVVRADVTPYDLAQKACADFKNASLVGIVLNGINGTSHYGSYYYNYYSGAKA